MNTEDGADQVSATAAIRRMIEDIETGFNTNDTETSVKHLTAEATAVNVAGLELVARNGRI